MGFPLPLSCCVDVDMVAGPLIGILDCEVILTMETCVRKNKEKDQSDYLRLKLPIPQIFSQKKNVFQKPCYFNIPFCYT